MSDIAFVVFEKEQVKGRQELLAKVGFLKWQIGTMLFHIFNKKKFRSGIRIFEIEPGKSVLLIKMPFPLSIFSVLNRPYIERYISKICLKNGCKSCFMPASARKPGGWEAYALDIHTRSVIFKALLLPILDEIYSKSGFRLDNLDTAFIHDGNVNELFIMVSQLEPFMKYINVAASDKQTVASKLSDICTDSGISIFVSSDYRSILRNAELIINLGDAAALSKFRIKPGSLMINFLNEENQKLQGEYTVIRGVEFTFPENQYTAMGEDILQNFNKAELTEILIAYKAGLSDGESYNEATVAAVLKVFKSNGCRITGFRGRRGVLRVENVLKAVRM